LRDRTRISTDERIGPFEALRDVTRHAINNGQFPIMLLSMILLSMIWRMRPEDIAALANRLIDLAETRCSVGYVLAVLFLSGWLAHMGMRRRLFIGDHPEVSGK